MTPPPRPATERSAPTGLNWFDPYLLVVWLATLPALTPLIQPYITHSADGLLHVYRLVALREALLAGAIFPRWLPDLAFGYGMPLFVFYAPLSYYLTLAINLVSPTLLITVNASFALSILVAATGSYLFVRTHFGPAAGLLASVVYAYAPFVLFNALSRGGLPAAWAMALYPLAFWAFARLIQSDRLVWMPLAALTLGLALLSHNTMTLLFMPLLGLYLAVALLLYAGRADWPARLARTALVGLLAVGSAAFFLLPAATEQPFAQVKRVITSPDFDFRYHFVALADLFALPQPANTGLLNPEFPLTLGIVPLALAMIGLATLTLRRHPPRQAALLIFALLALIAAVLMMLALSQPVWERLPLIEFVQFPHRLLGPAALLLAILAGGAVAGLPGRWRFWLTLGGIVATILTSLPLLYPRYNETVAPTPTLSEMMAYEQRVGAIGTTSFGEYLPIWVREIYPRSSPPEPIGRAGAPLIARLDPAYLPDGSTVTVAESAFNRASLTLDTPEPTQAVFHTFYFPGWTARLDGQAVPVEPFSERGLVSVAVPAGQHRLEVAFQNTPLRTLADGLSLGSLLGIVGLLGYALWRGSTNGRPLPAAAGLSRTQLGVIGGVALLLLGVKLGYVDQTDSLFKREFSGTVAAEQPLRVNFGQQISLLGYDLNRQQVQPGRPLDLTAYWQARQPLESAYSALAHLTDARRNLYAGQDNLHPGGLPTDQWRPWGFVQDRHHLRVPHGLPPGDYVLTLGLYDPASLERLLIFDSKVEHWGDLVPIPITVTPAEAPPSLAQLGIEQPLEVRLGPALTLLGATLEREALRPGELLRLALFWEARTAPRDDYQIELRLVSVGGELLLSQAGRPSYGRYPTPGWAAGERVRDDQALLIPATAPAGSYAVQLRLLNEQATPVSNWVEVGQIAVEP